MPSIGSTATISKVRLLDQSAIPDDPASGYTIIYTQDKIPKVKDDEGYVYSLIGSAIENAQTGTSYTLVPRDNGATLKLTNGSAITLTVDTNFPDGASVDVIQGGAGQVTVTGSGLTLRNASSHTKLRTQYSAVRLYRSGTDLFMWGDTAA